MLEVNNARLEEHFESTGGDYFEAEPNQPSQERTWGGSEVFGGMLHGIRESGISLVFSFSWVLYGIWFL